jgi:hypothetical protein
MASQGGQPGLSLTNSQGLGLFIHTPNRRLSRISRSMALSERAKPGSGNYWSPGEFEANWELTTKRLTMARDEHNKAAEHHENAAKAHRSAAEHHGKGDHAKGKEHANVAKQHSQAANQHTDQAHSKSQQQK